jgi:methionyl-tRNA formyltransferase
MVAGDGLRIVFFGTPAFAVPTLDALLASRHHVVGVVTQPDRPRGRGHKTSDAPVKARATAAGLPILQPARLKDQPFLDALDALHADLGVVAAYGKILTGAVLETPRLGMINVHASLLPRYRGAAPVHRAIIAGERETGVTIMRIVKALDAGPMLATTRLPIGPEDTSDEVERDLARLGAALLVATIDDLAAGRATETPQNDALATYAHRLTKEDGVIDWTWPGARIHNLIRGLHPWPHAFTFLRGTRLIIRRSEASDTSDTSDETGVSTLVSDTSDTSAEPGTILEAAGDRLVVATGAGMLHISEIQAEGKRLMTTRDFLAGHRLSRGDRFTATP